MRQCRLEMEEWAQSCCFCLSIFFCLDGSSSSSLTGSTMNFSAVTSALADRPKTYSLKRSDGDRFLNPKNKEGGVGLRLPRSREGDLERVAQAGLGLRGVMSKAFDRLFWGSSRPQGMVSGSMGVRGELHSWGGGWREESSSSGPSWVNSPQFWLISCWVKLWVDVVASDRVRWQSEQGLMHRKRMAI